MEFYQRRKACVPQDSCISDVLFLVYINDMPNHPGINKSQFADDSLFLRSHKNTRLAKRRFQSYLDRVCQFFKCWKMSICERKSRMINIIGLCTDTSYSLRKSTKEVEVKINGTKIESVKQMRYLGLWFSNNTSMKAHVDNAIRKSNIVVSKIRHLLRSAQINCNVKTLFYKSIVRPNLCYASPVWTNPSITSSAQMEQIRLLERKILRGCCKFPNNSTLYKAANTARVDKFFANKAINFITSCNDSEDSAIRDIASFRHQSNPKYLPTSFWSKWNQDEVLFDNDKLLIFNRSQRGPSRLVYSANQ